VQLDGEGDGDSAPAAASPAPGFLHLVLFLVLRNGFAVLVVLLAVVPIVRVVVVIVHDEVAVVHLSRLAGLLGLAAALRAGFLGMQRRRDVLLRLGLRGQAESLLRRQGSQQALGQYAGAYSDLRRS